MKIILLIEMNFYSINEEEIINSEYQNNSGILYSPNDSYINNVFNFMADPINLDEKNVEEKNHKFNQFSLNRIIDFKISPKDEISTNNITLKNKFQSYNIPLEETKEKTEEKPEFFSFDRIIKEIFKTNKELIQFSSGNKIIKNEAMEASLLKKKRFREFNDEDKNIFILIEEENYEEQGKKRGRAPILYSNNPFIHNKMSEDNVIKKIKSYIFKYVIKFTNKILNKTDKDEDRLYKLDYKYIDQIKREKDLELLNMPIKEFLSLDISKKCNRPPNLNKENIENILNIKKDDDTIQFVFNITLSDFKNLFIKKITITNFINQSKFSQYSNININKIKNSLKGIDTLLNKIAKKNNQQYFSLFCLLLYNYELWFLNKRPRNKKSKKKGNNIE